MRVMDENVSDMVVSSESSAGGDVIVNIDHIVQESCMLNKPNSTETKEVMCEKKKTKPRLSEDDLLQIQFRLTKMIRSVDSMDEACERIKQIGTSPETAMSPLAGIKMKHCFAFTGVALVTSFLALFVTYLFVKDL